MMLRFVVKKDGKEVATAAARADRHLRTPRHHRGHVHDRTANLEVRELREGRQGRVHRQQVRRYLERRHVHDLISLPSEGRSRHRLDHANARGVPPCSTSAPRTCRSAPARRGGVSSPRAWQGRPRCRCPRPRTAQGRGQGGRGQGEDPQLHRHLPGRLARPTRHLGHEAGRPGERPREVQADQDERRPASTSASTSR